MPTFDFAVEQIRGVHDGDTCRLLVDVGFGIKFDIDVRIDGIDTPEMMKEQKAAAVVARDALSKWLAAGLPTLRLYSRSWDKYGGRVVGVVYANGDLTDSASAFLISKRMGKPYDGSKKTPWTAAELAAIETMRTGY